MTVPVFPSMPVVLSRDEAAKQFGAGSQLHRIAAILDPPPPPTPEEQVEIDRRRAEQVVLAHRAHAAWAIPTAFGAVAECIALVETHATSLLEVDGSSGFTLTEWRELAFHSLALLYERTPELLPIGPAVHADCHGDDR